MNEVRDILLGMDFGKETSQLCYFDRKANEALSISFKAGAEEYEIPTKLCKRIENKGFAVGMEADYFAREHKGTLVENLYEACHSLEPVSVDGLEMKPDQLLAAYLEGVLKFMGMKEPVKHISCLVIAVANLETELVTNLQLACQQAGFRREQFQILSYEESFYYYVMKQHKEIWNRYVGWYEFSGNWVAFRRMSMNIAARPVLVRLEPAIVRALNEKNKDLEFYQFVNDTLKTDLYASVQITGKGFDPSWADKSIKALCKNHRKVFAGNNLFAKGACNAARERLETKELKTYLFLSESMITSHVGMEMVIKGAKTYYPLIQAGQNWYECRKEFDILLNGTNELKFLVTPMGEKTRTETGLVLTKLPERPAKTTRLRVSMSYSSPKMCDIEVRDLGFGEMFPSSGMIWKETMVW